MTMLSKLPFFELLIKRYNCIYNIIEIFLNAHQSIEVIIAHVTTRRNFKCRRNENIYLSTFIKTNIL